MLTWSLLTYILFSFQTANDLISMLQICFIVTTPFMLTITILYITYVTSHLLHCYDSINVECYHFIYNICNITRRTFQFRRLLYNCLEQSWIQNTSYFRQFNRRIKQSFSCLQALQCDSGKQFCICLYEVLSSLQFCFNF